MKDLHEQNYYELLDITADANQEAIVTAYNKARLTYGNSSPALYSLFNKDEAEELLKLIDEAYSVLSNQFKRKEYDEKYFSRPMIEEKPVEPKKKVEKQMRQQEVPKQKVAPTPVVSFQGNASPHDGVTRFGLYKKDTEFEAQIEKYQDFDGALLQKIRVYKNVSLDQICEFSKISRTYLTALENNDMASLPAIVFLRGFLVQYAKALNLDADIVSKTYLRNLSARKQ